MNRDELIQQVKREYAALAARQSTDHIAQSTAEPTPEAYYEALLGEVIARIEAGAFDGFSSGQEIVRAVTNGPDQWGVRPPMQ